MFIDVYSSVLMKIQLRHRLYSMMFLNSLAIFMNIFLNKFILFQLKLWFIKCSITDKYGILEWKQFTFRSYRKFKVIMFTLLFCKEIQDSRTNVRKNQNQNLNLSIRFAIPRCGTLIFAHIRFQIVIPKIYLHAKTLTKSK